MTALARFFHSHRFHGADAEAYQEKAAVRDRLTLRFISALMSVAQVLRLTVEWNLLPEAVGNPFYRLVGIASIVSLFLISFQKKRIGHLHLTIFVAYFLMATMLTLAKTNTPGQSLFVFTGLWLLVFLHAPFSFRPSLVALILALGTVMSGAVVEVSGGAVNPLAVLPLGLTMAMVTLLVSYAMDQHWRRAFQVELDLAASHAELTRTHAELRTAHQTLTTTRDQLVKAEKAAALGRLVANVAHCLNTPVGNVVAGASLITDTTQRLSAQMAAGTMRRSDLTRFIDLVGEAGALVLDNAFKTSNFIDTFKRLESDAGQTPVPIDLGDLLARLEPKLRAMTPPGIRLTIEATPDLATSGLTVRGQWHLLEAIVLEMVANATTHAFPQTRAGAVTLAARADGEGGVTLSVTDDGIGIDPEHLEHVFDPFYTDGKIGGAGLGLSILHNAVIGPLGGRVTLESHEGQGATLTIHLPAVATPGDV